MDNLDIPEVELKNAPTTLEAAIERIRALEQTLDNVCYTMEIASVTNDYSHARPYVDEGLALLSNRIVEVEQAPVPMNITIVEGSLKDLDAEDVRNIATELNKDNK